MKKLITRRNFLRAVGIAAAAAGLSACGNAASSAAAGTSAAGSAAASSGQAAGGSVTFWMQSYGNSSTAQQDLLSGIVADFKAQSGIDVTCSIVDWSAANEKYTLACTGGEAPDCADMFFTNSFHQMSSDTAGIMEVDDLVEELGGKDNYYTAGAAECYVDGHWYGVPWRFDTRVLMINTEDFAAKKLDPPTTWEELVSTAQALTEKDSSGNITHAGLAWYNAMGRYDQTWFTLLAGAGGSMMNDDYSEFTFNSDAGVESLQFLSDIINKYNVCQNSLDSTYDGVNEFAAGNASMLYGVTAETANNVISAQPDMKGKFQSVVLPSKSGSGPSSISFSAPICVYRTAQNPDATKEWVKYFCSPEVQLKVSKGLSLLNSSKKVMADSYFSQDAWLSAFVAQSERAVAGDMPLTTWSQLDAYPDGPICTMCAQVVDGQDIQASIDTCMADLKKIGY